jgi:hypothetical protein
MNMALFVFLRIIMLLFRLDSLLTTQKMLLLHKANFLYNNKMKSLKYFVLSALFGGATVYSLAASLSHVESIVTSQCAMACTAQDSGKVEKKASGDATLEESKKTIQLAPRYLFGVATSYADSVTYVTNIFEISGMEGRIQEKTPIGVDLYTQSLKDYLKEKGKTGYLCATYVCKSRKEAEQKVLKVRGNVQRNKMTALQPIGDFSFKYISTEHIYSNEQENSGEEILDQDF